MYKLILFLHLLAATVWTGGHLVLALTILPQALRQRSLTILQNFEANFEKIGIPALLIQVLSGLWLAHRFQPDWWLWFDFSNSLSHLIALKLALLLMTVVLALDARLRLIPRLSEDNLNSLAWHIVPVTVISVLFVFVGVSFRTGGLF